jgi:hypothetical protein
MTIDQKSDQLARLGYYSNLQRTGSGWHVTLYNSVMPSFSPPVGDGRTALEALQAADDERVRMEGRR